MPLSDWWEDIMYKQQTFNWNYSQVNPYPNYEDMIAHTDERLLPLGFVKEELGLSQDGEFMLYGYKLNEEKDMAWIDSNMHGSEWWTCYYCLDFIDSVWGDTYFDKKLTKNIRENFGLYYIPSMNPWGYQNVKYYQSRGVNLNRNFDGGMWEGYTTGNGQWEGNNYKGEAPNSEAETQHVVSKFEEIKPYLAINCHTTTGNGNGVDMNNRFKEYHLLTEDVQNTLKLSLPQAGTLDWNGQYSPSAQSYYGTKTSKSGTKTITTIVEHQSDTENYNVGLMLLFVLFSTILNYKLNNELKLTDIKKVYQ